MEVNPETVIEKTGKPVEDWFELLDEWNAEEKGHKKTAAFLREEHGVSAWWAQTLTVEYERERGLREVGQRSDGKFGISLQRTVDCSIEEATEALFVESGWRGWFDDSHRADIEEGGSFQNAHDDCGEFLTVKRGERLRFSWEHPEFATGSLVEFRLSEKDNAKVLIRMDHTEIEGKEQRDDMKWGWGWALDSLKSYLETGEAIDWEDWKEQNPRE